MPINELIARGVTPLGEGVPNTLYQIAMLREAKARDAEFARRTQILEDNAAQDRQFALEDRATAQQQRIDEQGKQKLGMMIPLVEAGDPAAIEEAITGISQHNPQLGAILRQNPQQLVPVMRRALGEEAGGGIKTGAYNPGDYTPRSWAMFLNTQDPAVLERQYAPQQPPAPILINTPGYGAGLVDRRTGQPIAQFSTPEQEQAARAAAASAEQAAKSAVDTQAAKDAKLPAQQSLDYVVNQFRPVIRSVPSGGFMGSKQYTGQVTDFQGSARFDNLREQLSTELRTVFRIPGEGTLSDREQAQYGLQLPSRKYSPEVNESILNDIQSRVGLRLGTGSAPAAPAPQGGLTPDEQAELEALRKRFRGQ